MGPVSVRTPLSDGALYRQDCTVISTLYVPLLPLRPASLLGLAAVVDYVISFKSMALIINHPRLIFSCQTQLYEVGLYHK